MHSKKFLIKRLFSLVMATLLLWTGLLPGILPTKLVNAVTIRPSGRTTAQSSNSNRLLAKNWNEIDNYLQKAIRNAHDSTEEFASSELDRWVNARMEAVDKKFLDWYFNYINQKAMEFGVPFAWLTFQLDSTFKVFRAEDEKELNADQVIQKRMIEDFNNKFQNLVFDDQAKGSLKEIIDRVGRNFSSSIGYSFALIKTKYKVSDTDWELHLKNISDLIYGTGNNQSSLSAQNINSQLTTKLFALTTLTIGGKIAANLAAKSGGKLLTKAGTSAFAETGAKLLNPLVAVGFLAWDVWDYQHMVSESRPQLRKNIENYLTQLKLSILDSPDNSIMAALEEIEDELLTALKAEPA